MASLVLRTAFNSVKRSVGYTALRSYTLYLDPKELVTGLEKRELEALESGKDPDPFGMLGLQKGPGTKDQPTLVPSVFGSRLVGCRCEEEMNHINFLWVYKGTPTRCECGHWYKIVDKAPL